MATTEASGIASTTSSTSTAPKASKSSLLSTSSGLVQPLTKTISEIDWVPLSVPRHRRLQMAAVALWALLLPLCCCFYFFLLSHPILWPPLLAYTIWFYYIDQAADRGGRPSKWVRSWRWWDYFSAYYPASLKKEQDLPADRPYVFGYHPHGIIGMGAIATFATESTGFGRAYPGLKPHLLTLASNFKIPFYRDFLLSLGICSVSKRSCTNILKQGAGSAITIVVGGATESLAAHPGTANLTLLKRFGFIKIAIQNGADLVPVFSFGENDIYEQMPNQKGTTLHALQKKFQAVFGFTFPVFHGRGLLNYNFGLMPYRRSIVCVIGRPIHVVQCDNPTKDMVLDAQSRYVEELRRIWDTYKDLYAQTRTMEMVLVE